MVYEDGLPVPLQGYATEPCHQWAFPIAPLYYDLEACPFPMLCLYGALVAPEHFASGGFVLACEGLSQRLPHDPLQSPELGDVVGRKVILDDAPELRLIPAYDGVIIIGQQFVAVCRFAVAHVGLAVLLDDFGGNSQSDVAIDAASTEMVVLVVGLLVHEFIAEEPCRLAGGMGYESLVLR